MLDEAHRFGKRASLECIWRGITLAWAAFTMARCVVAIGIGLGRGDKCRRVVFSRHLVVVHTACDWVNVEGMPIHSSILRKAALLTAAVFL